MSSAADDRLIMGKRSHSRTTRSRQRAREMVTAARRNADARVAEAEAAVQVVSDKLGEMYLTVPRLEEFEKHWLTAGFFRRVWNAVRYVFLGSNALPRMREEQTWQS